VLGAINLGNSSSEQLQEVGWTCGFNKKKDDILHREMWSAVQLAACPWDIGCGHMYVILSHKEP